MGGRMLRAPTRGQPGLVAAASRCHRPKAPNKGQIHGAGAAPWAGDTGALWSLWHGEGPSVPVGTASARGCCRGLPALISMERRFPAKKPEKRLGLLQSSPKESRSPPSRALCDMGVLSNPASFPAGVLHGNPVSCNPFWVSDGGTQRKGAVLQLCCPFLPRLIQILG